MNDRILLMLGALITTAIAWAFWHFFDTAAFSILSGVAMLVLAVDNVQLRRALRASNVRV